MRFWPVRDSSSADTFAGMEGRRIVSRVAGFVVVLAPLALLSGCIHSDNERSGFVDGRYWCERVADAPSQPFIGELRSELLALGPDVSEAEATLLADVAVKHAEHIRREWGIVKPIELHNTLVNLGLRPRGLCYQCAEAMYERLRALDLKTFDLHWGVAHKGDLWLEHSGVIVTAKGRPFSDGLVVDAWRHSGRLRWARVEGDRYPWVQMIKWKYPETARFFEDTAVAERRGRNEADAAGDAVPAAARAPKQGRAGGDDEVQGRSADEPDSGRRADSRADSRPAAGPALSADVDATGKQLSAIVTTRPKRQWP
jgi:hypothetical protein